MGSDINALILDYLTMEGYPKAAANFSKEANLRPQQDDESMQSRQDIQNSIHSGDIETAVTLLNELDPEVCAPLLPARASCPTRHETVCHDERPSYAPLVGSRAVDEKKPLCEPDQQTLSQHPLWPWRQHAGLLTLPTDTRQGPAPPLLAPATAAG